MYTMTFDYEHETISSATKPMFYGWTTYMLRYKDENYINLNIYYDINFILHSKICYHIFFPNYK
jgi:hypothetical protein